MEKSRADERPWLKNKKRIKNFCQEKQQIPLWKRLVLAELHAGVQISNKEVAVKPKFAIHNVKSEVFFSLCKPLYKNIDNRQESSVASNLEAVCGFVVLLLSTFSDFSIFADGFSFASGNFAHYCDVLLIAPLTVSAMGYFSREILIHGHWWQEVPLSHWLPVSRSEIISWRGASCLICEPLWAKISHLILGGIQPLWPIL